MIRKPINPRSDWKTIVENQGLLYNTLADGRPYWNESAYYEFTSKEIDAIESATNELQEMCLNAGQYIIDKKLFPAFRIPKYVEELIVAAWNAEPPAIYGRFDLGYNGKDIKLLEYNADTPTSLVEAAVVQWFWLQDRFPQSDQFNSIHERLVEKWKSLKGYVSDIINFAYAESGGDEDLMTVTYLADTAQQAGYKANVLNMLEIGFNERTGKFVDDASRPMKTVFKLYPWEWMVHESFGLHLPETFVATDWIEPIWKMMWSNKALLAVLWEMYPGHELLLPSFLEENLRDTGSVPVVRKPILSREGANVTISAAGQTLAKTEGEYGEDGYVVQQYFEIPKFDGKTPVIGSWVIDGEAAGMGIRETSGLVTDNLSSFVPHLFR